jgi:hypothetical protein
VDERNAVKWTFLTVFVNSGTGSLLLMIVSVAWSTNFPSSLHSMRMMESVRTVKRAVEPTRMTDFGSGSGEEEEIEESKAHATQKTSIYRMLQMKEGGGKGEKAEKRGKRGKRKRWLIN